MIAEITWVHWTAFLLAVILCLSMDLDLFHRKAHAVRFKEAMLCTAIWVAIAMGFAWGLNVLRAQEEALEFLTGYIVELFLSIDNVFVMALIFSYFQVPSYDQQRLVTIVNGHRMFTPLVLVLIMVEATDFIFALAGAIEYFRYLKVGLSLVLVFIGVKMLLLKFVHISTIVSLGIIGTIILASGFLLSAVGYRAEIN